MIIFVGYGYQERDSWIEDLVFPLVKSFGNNVSRARRSRARSSARASRSGFSPPTRCSLS